MFVATSRNPCPLYKTPALKIIPLPHCLHKGEGREKLPQRTCSKQQLQRGSFHIESWLGIFQPNGSGGSQFQFVKIETVGLGWF